MAYQLDAKFFRKAKKVNRAVEITDTYAVIPAVKDSPEIRVALPNRRPKTMEERGEVLEERFSQISELEQEIEVERRRLMELTKAYRATPVAGVTEVAGVAEIVVQNLKIQNLMDRRRSLRYPEAWIESLGGLTLVDVFASKRDARKLDAYVYQVKNRVEPIESLYVDLGAAAATANAEAEDDEEFVLAVPKPTEVKAPAKAPTAEERAKGAIIASAKKSFKLKASKAPFGPVYGTGGGGGGGGGP
jgi:hypothetical protein